jgi:hypothetical protein
LNQDAGAVTCQGGNAEEEDAKQAANNGLPLAVYAKTQESEDEAQDPERDAENDDHGSLSSVAAVDIAPHITTAMPAGQFPPGSFPSSSSLADWGGSGQILFR